MWSTRQQFVRRLTRAVYQHGLIRTLRLGVRETCHQWTVDRAERRALRERQRLEREFDRQFGVDTAGKVALTALEISSDNTRFGRRYGATRQDRFQDMISRLPINHRDFVFIDFGSGKGKALLLASDLPFKQVIGVEFARELHEVAVQNIERYKSPTRQCADMHSLCMDAAAYPIPDQPLVCYFFDPFTEEVMTKVLANLRHSLEKQPRDLYLIYHNPRIAHLLDSADFLEKTFTAEHYLIYRNRPITRQSAFDSSEKNQATPAT